MRPDSGTLALDKSFTYLLTYLLTRFVLGLDHRAYMKPVLQSLHWLSVKAQIEFKITTNATRHISATWPNSAVKNL